MLRSIVAAALAAVLLPRPSAGGAAGCTAPPASTGAFQVAIGDAKRDVRVHLPADYDGRRTLPVVLAFHGLGGSAEEFARGAGFDELWPDAIRVYPQGLFRVFPERPGFHGDGWQIRAGELDDRDLRFFDGLLDWLAERYCIEPRAVFATGFSNGGYFSNLLGCERPRRVAAIAPVAGAMRCTPHEPVAAIVVHGTEDRTIGFDLGVDAARRWAERDGCAEGSREDEDGCRTRSCKVGEVALCAFPVSHSYGPELTRVIVAFFRRRLAAVDSPARVD